MESYPEHLVLDILCDVIHVLRTSAFTLLCTFIGCVPFGITSDLHTLRFTYLACTNGTNMKMLQLYFNRDHKLKYYKQ